VRIESIVGVTLQRSIPIAEWEALLLAIAHPDRSRAFGVSSRLTATDRDPSLHELINDNVTGGSDTRLRAYVTAILIHEGTLMIHHGPLGRGWEARVVLMRSEREL